MTTSRAIYQRIYHYMNRHGCTFSLRWFKILLSCKRRRWEMANTFAGVFWLQKEGIIHTGISPLDKSHPNTSIIGNTTASV